MSRGFSVRRLMGPQHVIENAPRGIQCMQMMTLVKTDSSQGLRIELGCTTVVNHFLEELLNPIRPSDTAWISCVSPSWHNKQRRWVWPILVRPFLVIPQLQLMEIVFHSICSFGELAFGPSINQMLKRLCGRTQDATPTTKDQFQWDSSPLLLEQDPFSPALFNDETTTRDSTNHAPRLFFRQA